MLLAPTSRRAAARERTKMELGAAVLLAARGEMAAQRSAWGAVLVAAARRGAVAAAAEPGAVAA